MGDILSILRVEQRLDQVIEVLVNFFTQTDENQKIEAAMDDSEETGEFCDAETEDLTDDEDENVVPELKDNLFIKTQLEQKKPGLKEGFAKMTTRRSMTNVLKDIVNVKQKLRKVPTSPGGRPVRLKPIPNNSNELYAVLRKRYAAMHSPSENYKRF